MAALLVCLAPTTVLADPADDEHAGMPITDPSWEPEVVGLGIEPGVQGAFNSPTLLYVNFEGGPVNSGCGNDSHNDCSTLPIGSLEPFPGDDAVRLSVIQAAREDVEDFGVIVVGERPPDNQPYAMVMVGEPSGGGWAGVGGVAPTIDCGNTNPNITSFGFITSGSNTVATVIHQEAAHTWGLEHVDDQTDNLFPTAGGTTDPKYQDVCSQIVADTQLNPTGGRCNQVHTMFCQSGNQNSFQEMLALFGPPIPDDVAPEVVISAPADGATLDYEENFDLTVVLSDDRRPQALDTIILFDEEEALSSVFLDTELTFPIPGGDRPDGHGLTNGDHTIRVEIQDESGNPAFAEITITIENGPGGNPNGDDDDDGDGGSDGDGDGDGGTGSGSASGGDGGDGGDGGGCGCQTHAPSHAAWLAPLLLLGFGRRRH